MRNLMVYGMALLAMVFWSLTYIWYKTVFIDLKPISVMVVRLAFSTIMLFAFARLTKRLQHVNKIDMLWFALLALFQPFLYFLFESFGVSMVSATISAVIISTIPVFTLLVAYLFLKEKFSYYNILGIVLSFVGVLIVVFGRDFYFDGSWLGIALLFGAVFSALAYALIIVKVSVKHSSFTIICWQNFWGTLYFVPLFFIYEFTDFCHAEFSLKLMLNLFYLAAFGSSLAYVFFTFSIKKMGIVRASMFTNTIPIFTAIFAYFILGETLGVDKWIGIVFVLFGLLLSQMKKKV